VVAVVSLVDERAQWLTAALDRVVATAEAAVWCGYQLKRSEPTGEWLAVTGPGAASVEDAASGEIVAYDEGSPTDAQAEHIATWDPRSVLARVEADRKILGWCVEVIGDRDLSSYDEFGSLRDDRDAMAVTLAVETLRNLLSAYRYMPGFNDGWLV
jgi:hypothetical protein